LYNEKFLRPAYIRDCYYRLITEILVCNGHAVVKNNNKIDIDRVTPFVVVGNPGIGKTSLSYLFIRALMEMGVKAYFIFF
jgi:Holliday junction resolvasome RuvABC ATP-dependent DNA helicase subunit